MGSSTLKFRIVSGLAVIFLMAAFATVTTAQCVPVPSGAVSWWPAENTASDTFNRNNAVLNGNATFAPGKVGQAFALDGVGDYAQVLTTSSLPVGASPRTFEVWFRTSIDLSAQTESGIVQYGTATAGNMFGLITSANAPGKLYFYGHGADLAGVTTLLPNTWYHGAVTYDGVNVKLYLNGQLESQAPIGLNTVLDASGLLIGNREGSSFWTGQIDEPAVYDRELSAAEIAAIFTAGSAGKCRSCASMPTGAVGWWPGDGNGVDIVSGSNGSLVNGPTFTPGFVDLAFNLNPSAQQFIEVSPQALALMNNSSGSITAWINQSPLGVEQFRMVTAFGTGAPGEAVGFGIDNGNVRVYHHTETFDWQTGVPVNTDTWTFLAYTWDGSTERLYKNGTLAASRARNFNFVNSGFARIGFGFINDPSVFFSGRIDEVMTFNRTLNDAEVASIYNASSWGVCRTCAVSSVGTVGWWRAEETGFDFMGANNGSLVNGAAFAPGKVGQAFTLDGIDDMVVVPDAPNLNFGPFEPMTIHMWAYPTENRAMHLIGKRASCFDSGQSANYQIAQDASGLHFNSGGVLAASGVFLPVNQWSHVAATFDGSMVRLFLNGVERSSEAATLASSSNGAPVIIGGTCFDAGARFPGVLDEVTIVNSALTARELAAITNAGNAGICSFGKDCAAVPPGMLASWRGEGNAFDRKKLHNGTLLNGTAFDSGISGKAFSFDGTNDYVSIPAFNMGADWTIEGWINPARCSDATHCTFAARSAGNFDGIAINYLGPGHPMNNEFALNIGNGSEWQVSLRSNTKYGFGRWYHIAASKSGDTYTLYVDGVAVAQQTVANVSGNYQTRDMTLGTWNYGVPAYLLGRVDDVAVYDGALSGAEINAIVTSAQTGMGKCGGCQTTADFDGDTLSDISIFRPNGTFGAEWWTLGSAGGVSAAQFGSATDKVVAADFTGDGKTDIAFWRPDTGFWYILRSDDFTFYAYPFGGTGDIPMPADYDGDGIADAAVFRPSNSYWYINRSTGGVAISQFGAAGDQPVAADYDGDGKADIAVFRPNGTGGAEWWIANSSGGVFATQFGQPTDKAVPADYTGDGRTDIAYWNTSNGYWYILRSEDYSYFAFPFGGVGDLPVPADYDSDNKADAGVFRPSNANWFLNRSTAGTLIQQFGTTGDQPVPNAFVR